MPLSHCFDQGDQSSRSTLYNWPTQALSQPPRSDTKGTCQQSRATLRQSKGVHVPARHQFDSIKLPTCRQPKEVRLPFLCGRVLGTQWGSRCSSGILEGGARAAAASPDPTPSTLYLGVAGAAAGALHQNLLLASISPWVLLDSSAPLDVSVTRLQVNSNKI
jgi:hypothetical protein